MNKKNFAFISFWLLLAMSVVTTMFISCRNDEPSKTISLNKTSFSLFVGNEYTLVVTPAKKNVTWKSNDSILKKVVIDNGKVTAIDTGIVVITAEVAGEIATCTVVIFGESVTLNGKKWATRNVDKPGTFTAKPEDPGMFYQWNSKTGWSYTDPATSTDGSAWNPLWNGNGVTTAWESANKVCPAGWRMPNESELSDLYSTGDDPENIWTSIDGMGGRRLGSSKNNSVFLPAAGFRSKVDGKYWNANGYGYYWGSRYRTGTVTELYPSSLYLDSKTAYVGYNYDIANAFCIRCIAE